MFSAPLPRSSALLALTSVILLVAMKSSLTVWLNDLPSSAVVSALIDVLQLIPDFGLSDAFETLRNNFLQWLRN